jgi:hypothetical protein
MPDRMMLNEKQETLLRWIADGCPDGVMPDDSHRMTAAAQRNSGLATTSGRGPTWQAKLTAAGRAYLDQLELADGGPDLDGLVDAGHHEAAPQPSARRP